MARVIGYARVSKKEQAENSHALEQQQNRLRMAGAEEILTDVVSGRKDDRDQFQHLMELVRQKKIEKVIVTRIDRLGRSLPSVVKAFRDFRESGVILQVLDGSVDLSTVGGRAQANIMAALAEMESEMISDRSQHGWEYLRQRRVAMNPPFGYKKVEDRHELDKTPLLCVLSTREELSKAQIARDLVEIFLEKQSLRQTIRYFNQKYGIQKFEQSRSVRAGFEDKGVFQRSTSGLSKWLISPVLRGHLIYFADDPDRKVIHYDTHPEHRLITDEEFKAIEEILGINRERKGFGYRAPVYPLSGLVKCAVCGGTCYASKAGKGIDRRKRDYGYYYCQNASVGSCPQKNYVRMDWVEEQVKKRLLAKAEEISHMIDYATPVKENPRLQELRSQLKGLEQLGPNPAIEIAKQDIQSQIQSLLFESKENREDQAELQKIIEVVAKEDFWEIVSSVDKRSIFRTLINKILVRPAEDQPIAKTQNKFKQRQRHLDWEIEILLKT